MGKEAERPFLEKVSEYLLSLPFDLKILQEAVSDPELERDAREIAAGTIIHTIAPQEGEGPIRYVDDVLLVRAALKRILAEGGEHAKDFATRFDAEVYGKLHDDLAVFESVLGDLWPWLTGKLESFRKPLYKGKTPSQYVDDDEAASSLYEEGLEFQTNYNVTEDKVRNSVRRIDTILEQLNKRRAEDAKKKT
ncbi:MAG: hypothetical protein JWN44_7108 [Myxococcales bacterium]|nr:hypothetical protein [Myxococcales bacterium]